MGVVGVVRVVVGVVGERVTCGDGMVVGGRDPRMVVRHDPTEVAGRRSHLVVAGRRQRRCRRHRRQVSRRGAEAGHTGGHS